MIENTSRYLCFLCKCQNLRKCAASAGQILRFFNSLYKLISTKTVTSLDAAHIRTFNDSGMWLKRFQWEKFVLFILASEWNSECWMKMSPPNGKSIQYAHSVPPKKCELSFFYPTFSSSSFFYLPQIVSFIMLFIIHNIYD